MDFGQNGIKVVMSLGQKFLTRVGSNFCGSGRVSHLWFGFEFQKFPLKMSNFSIFSLRVKKIPLGRKVPRSKPDRTLVYCGSKVSSGQGPSLDQRLFACSWDQIRFPHQTTFSGSSAFCFKGLAFKFV